jgi:tetratricopeptide (TPR) repeat protein
MRQRLRFGAAGLGAALCLVGRVALAEPTARDLATKSLEECEHGRQAPTRPERASAFARGEELATRAIALDDHSADAHFAWFCNRGEAMRLDGETLRDVFGIRSLMRELDRTLELQPDHAGALSAKGTFLVRLPRVLGGDVDRGEAILQRVLQLDPTAVAARIALARVCEYRGKREEGIAYASRALQFARELGRADKVAEAQAMLDELHASR